MTMYTNAAGDIKWYKHNELHRDDGPAIEFADGAKQWWQNGERHRDDGPAIEWSNGDVEWYKHGKKHRDDGPAVEYADGDVEWYQHGKLHRTDGPAMVWCSSGNVFWIIDDTNLTSAEFAAKVLDEETAMLWKMSGYCWPFDFGGGNVNM